MNKSGQVTHFNISAILSRVRLHLTADSLTLLVLGPHQAQIVLIRARLPRPRSYGARRVRSCPKRLQAFAVFPG